MKKYLILFCASMLAVVSGCTKNPIDNGTDKVKLNRIDIASTLDVEVGKQATLTVTFAPPHATDRKVTWGSDDAAGAVLTIDPSTGVITGVKRGKATVTATSHDGGLTDNCLVTVIPVVPEGMVFVEGGTFMMGADATNERPIHEVTVSDFAIGRYEVTQKQWKEIMGANPSYDYTVGDDRPVNNITFNDILAFIAKLNEQTGMTYRLPTESEWEYAAKGGNKSKGYLYSGSNDLDEVGWYVDNSKSADNKAQCQPVGLKMPNELGIYDMSGNVWEFCSDYYNKTYPSEPQTDPTGPADPDNAKDFNRVCRGGACYLTPSWLRTTQRNFYSQTNPYAHVATLGFRLAL